MGQSGLVKWVISDCYTDCMVTFISDKRILQVMEKDIFEQHKSHKLQNILMAVKKFVFRENWYGSRWLV